MHQIGPGDLKRATDGLPWSTVLDHRCRHDPAGKAEPEDGEQRKPGKEDGSREKGDRPQHDPGEPRTSLRPGAHRDGAADDVGEGEERGGRAEDEDPRLQCAVLRNLVGDGDDEPER